MVTDRADGLPRYLKESSDAYRLSLAAMASCSIPVLNAPVELDGRHDYDGGVGDSIPVGRALAKGYGKVVVVLTRRAGSIPEWEPKPRLLTGCSSGTIPSSGTPFCPGRTGIGLR